MSRFEQFELPVSRIQEYPLIFEVATPEQCSLFQDVRRYQSITANLDVRIINVDGRIYLEQGMIPVPMSKLSNIEKKELSDYLRLRLRRGDNIGSSWIFFRSEANKKPLIAFGANVVYKNSSTGQARAAGLLTELQKSGPGINLLVKILISLIIAGLLGSTGYYGYHNFIKSFIKNKSFNIGKYLPGPESDEMEFYQIMFPDIYEWLYSDVVDQQIIAKEILKPEYIKDIIACMEKDFYKESDNSENSENYRGNRLVLFVYFNYNAKIKEALKNYGSKLENTEFGRLAGIYSCDESGYSSNIFYFKVGDLELKPTRINQFLTDNMISYNDYKRLRDNEAFSRMLEKDNITFRLKNFLSDVYTFSPLKVGAPIEDIDWYLLVRRDNGGKVNFAAFFKRGESTLLPREISNKLTALPRQTLPLQTLSRQTLPLKSPLSIAPIAATLKGEISGGDSSARKDITGGYAVEGDIFTWYRIDDNQKRVLNLTNDAIGYFSEKIGQASKLKAVDQKINELELEKIEGHFPLVIHRELLMEDSKGKYGIQCYDPVTSLVLSNIISKSSFEKSSNISLKRDPIQVNTSLIQLSRDDSTSTQAINISPGKAGIVNMFKKIDSFRGKLATGAAVKFQKADLNLFNPFSFMVYSDSITFSYRHEINGMEFAIQKKVLKIVKSSDGGYQIIKLD